MDLVEVVARAMIQDQYGRISAAAEVYEYANGETVIEEIKDRFEQHAQAAIQAIREHYAIVPREATEAMVDAAEGSDSLYWSPEEGEGLDSVAWDDAYKAMIEAGEVK